MHFPEVIIFCKSEKLIASALKDLAYLGLNKVKVFASELPPPDVNFTSSNLKLVICDFFHSSDHIKLFRKLFEHEAVFTVLKNRDMETFAAWGVDRFIIASANVVMDPYAGLPTQMQITAGIESSRLRDVARVQSKDHRDNNRTYGTKKSDFPSKIDVLAALKADEIAPYFQPKVCLKTNCIKGVEVLARWRHPEYGVLSPSVFMSSVHENQYHEMLLESLLKQGMIVQRELNTLGNPLIFSFNIDATQLVDEGFSNRLVRTVNSSGGSLDAITLEITETASLKFDMNSIENIMNLARSGVSFSLDDFGTGYSSIQRLALLPFKQIKLDQTFVSSILDLKVGRIVTSVVSLANSLGLEIVAEGVETEVQWKKLKALGINSVQGYFFYKPMCGDDLIELIRALNVRKVM